MEIKMHDIVVIGSSAGGVNALKELLSSFPGDLVASVFIVQHVAADHASHLPQILSAAGKLKAVHPRDGDPILPGYAYIAPPDYHMILEKDRILVKKGPKENHFRPSIDVMMRSAAYWYGPRVIGVVLTGLLNDGTSGMWSVKYFGGTCLVQSPSDAQYPDMPRYVLENMEVDYSVPLSEMGAKIAALTHQPVASLPDVNEAIRQRLKLEIDAAAQQNAFEEGIMKIGEKSGLTCPECGGAMVLINEGNTIRYRCHTGHGFSSASLFLGITESIEANLWRAVRSIEEGIMLFEQLAGQSEKSGNAEQTKLYDDQSAELRKRASALLAFIYDKGQIADINNSGT